ncbi:MAG: hypothetical protein M1817_006217 [Caeruleum heppii]|nr:MAG: hypothetical protein M1817_006217 [Caeruleum heppii]
MASAPALQHAALHAGAGLALNPVNQNYNPAPSSPVSTGPPLSFSSFPNVFHPHLSGQLSYQSPSAFCPSPASLSHAYAMSEIRPGIHASSATMPPPSRSSSIQSTVPSSLVAAARDTYNSATPHLSRHSVPNRSPVEILSRTPRSPLSSSSRGTQNGLSTLSPSSSTTFGNSSGQMQLDPASQLGLSSVNQSPPLKDTDVHHQIKTADGQDVRPDINARIDKGFFLCEQDWTCYRRNYFSVACSYTLTPSAASSPLYLNRSAVLEPIQAFAMTISAVVEGPGEKPVELVQHTPKRDKGPQGRPDRVKLNPHTAGAVGMFSGGSAAGSHLASGAPLPTQPGYDPSYAPQTAEQQTVATFERIQFKSATANNGKRRAAQQYYQLIVELHADVGGALGSDRWIKVATRLSAPMVVRGRSPGHYQDDHRRASSSSAGPGGAGGSDGGPGASGGSSGSRSLADSMAGLGGYGGMMGGSGYHGASGYSSVHHSPTSLNGHSLSSGSSSADPIDHGSRSATSPTYPFHHSTPFGSSMDHNRARSQMRSSGLPSFSSQLTLTEEPEEDALPELYGSRVGSIGSGVADWPSPSRGSWTLVSPSSRQSLRSELRLSPTCGRSEVLETRARYQDLSAV